MTARQLHDACLAADPVRCGGYIEGVADWQISRDAMGGYRSFCLPAGLSSDRIARYFLTDWDERVLAAQSSAAGLVLLTLASHFKCPRPRQ
jgi:hypothetical protein